MKKTNKTVAGVVLSLALILSMGLTALAASSSTYFTYGGETVNCYINVDWKVGKDKAYSKTYVSDNNSGTYPLGAFINAYKNGTLLGGTSASAFDKVTTSTISYTADEFRSIHNIQNSSRVPKKSTKLNITD